MKIYYLQFEYLYTELPCTLVGTIDDCISEKLPCKEVEQEGFSTAHGMQWHFFRDERYGSHSFTLPMRVGNKQSLQWSPSK